MCFYFCNFILCGFFSFIAQSTVDKLIKKTNLALVVGTNSWRDQFMEAITVSAGTHFLCAFHIIFYFLCFYVFFVIIICIH